MASTADLPKVLLFAGQFAVRGQSGYTLRLARGLPEQGIRPSVVCPDACVLSADVRQALQIRVYPHLLQPILGRLMLEILRRQLSLDPPDIIHAQSQKALSGAAWIARKLDRPLVVTVHDFLNPNKRLRIDRSVCQRILAVSEAVRNDLITQHKLPAEMITVISSGVPSRPLEPEEMVLNSAKVPVVGTAGPLEAVKGLPFFLGAAARVLATGRDVEFVVAGAGPEEQNLRRLTRELGIAEHVTFLPNLSDFTPALEAMDIFCLPSLSQGLGTVMLEAMALGRPVIATKVGGVFQVVHDGKTGLLVPPSNSAQLADRMLELLDDPLKARRLGQAAHEVVESQFNLERMVSQTADVYREMLEQRAPVAMTA